MYHKTGMYETPDGRMFYYNVGENHVTSPKSRSTRINTKNTIYHSRYKFNGVPEKVQIQRRTTKYTDSRRATKGTDTTAYHKRYQKYYKRYRCTTYHKRYR